MGLNDEAPAIGDAEPCSAHSLVLIAFVYGFRRSRAPREFVGLGQSLDYLRRTLRWATHLDPPEIRVRRKKGFVLLTF